MSIDNSFFERVESLGDNCEFGFVCRNCGFEFGSLFRWASIKPSALLALLLNDFRDIYEYKNLSPFSLAMVKERIYDIGWHSDLKSVVYEGNLKFRDEEAVRELLFRTEQRKISYLVQKFRARLRSGGCIYFIKCNTGISALIICAIYQLLRSFSEGKVFWLVNVRLTEHSEVPGTVTMLKDGRIEALVSHFASYDTANVIDLEEWTGVLQKVSGMTLYENWSSSREQAKTEVESLFHTLPLGSKSHIGEMKYYVEKCDNCCFTITNVHFWTRVVDGDRLRVHVGGWNGQSTIIRWVELSIKNETIISFEIKNIINENHTVIVQVRMINQLEVVLREEYQKLCNFQSMHIEFRVPVLGDAICLEIECSSEFALNEGERAAVDISQPFLSLTL